VKLRQNLLLWFLLPLAAGCSGCGDSAASRRSDSEKPTEQLSEELFAWAIGNLNRLEEFDTGDMLPEIVKRLEQPNAPAEGGALMQTWPMPEMLRQVVNRLNQWIRARPPAADWQADPIIETLPEPLGELSQVRELGKLEFSTYDGFALREVVWLRDVSAWARGDELNDLDRAGRLFDWTVRNIQLESALAQPGDEPAARVPLLPWETLMFGRGTGAQRAWVFILLARQQGLDAAMLAIDTSSAQPPAADETPPKPPGDPLQPWVVGVLIEGQWYLFDPALGLPIPGPEGVKLDEAGRLDIRPATLAQVAADDGLLRRLDISESICYPVQASDLKRVVALVEASPTYLARRMKMVESRLAGEQRMVLSIDATALAARFAAGEQIAEARLWTHPYETLLARSRLGPEGVRSRLVELLPYYSSPGAPLGKGRMLYLKGAFTGRHGATREFQQSRPPNRVLAAAKIHQVEKVIYLRAKQNAGYWLGLIAFERGNYSSAIDYFLKRTLEAWPGGPWQHGALYNLGRTYAAAGQTAKAVETYRAAAGAPGYMGNLLRAKWLEELRSEQEIADRFGKGTVPFSPRENRDSPPVVPGLIPKSPPQESQPQAEPQQPPF